MYITVTLCGGKAFFWKIQLPEMNDEHIIYIFIYDVCVESGTLFSMSICMSYHSYTL